MIEVDPNFSLIPICYTMLPIVLIDLLKISFLVNRTLSEDQIREGYV